MGKLVHKHSGGAARAAAIAKALGQDPKVLYQQAAAAARAAGFCKAVCSEADIKKWAKTVPAGSLPGALGAYVSGLVVTKAWLVSLSSTQRRAGHRHRPMRKLGGGPSRSTALQLHCPPRQWCPNRQLDVLPLVVVLPLSRSSSRSPSPSPSPCLSQSKFLHHHVHLATLSSRQCSRVPFQLLRRRVVSQNPCTAAERTRDRTDTKKA